MSQENSPCYLGIDPGKKGAICFLRNGVPEVYQMPETIEGLYEMLNVAVAMGVLEHQQAFPGQGVVSMFKFGVHYGILQSMLYVREIPFQIILPIAWKKTILTGLPWKGDKMVAVEYVKRKYPKLGLPRAKDKMTGFADAVCLAEMARFEDGHSDNAGQTPV